VHQAGLEVDVGPGKRKQFALAQPEAHLDSEERVQLVLLHRRQKRPASSRDHG
jgi:hypothetical protein